MSIYIAYLLSLSSHKIVQIADWLLYLQGYVCPVKHVEEYKKLIIKQEFVH